VEAVSSDELSSQGPAYAMASQPAQGDAGGHLSFEEHEKHLVKSALEKAAGNQSEAARQLRIGRDALRYKMKKYGLL
jgi:transcriptional regulator with PAS, ATPase and Fis domain